MKNQSIIKNFGILYRTFLYYVSEEVSEKEITFSDSIFLVNVGKNEGISQNDLSKSLAIDKAAVARSIKSMEKKGYLRIQKSDYDKRMKKLYLTDTGTELFQFVSNLNTKWLDQILIDFTDAEIHQFNSVINRISQRAKENK